MSAEDLFSHLFGGGGTFFNSFAYLLICKVWEVAVVDLVDQEKEKICIMLLKVCLCLSN